LTARLEYTAEVRPISPGSRPRHAYLSEQSIQRPLLRGGTLLLSCRGEEHWRRLPWTWASESPGDAARTRMMAICLLSARRLGEANQSAEQQQLRWEGGMTDWEGWDRRKGEEKKITDHARWVVAGQSVVVRGVSACCCIR